MDIVGFSRLTGANEDRTLAKKSAKIIALLEEFRLNDPNQGNDRDEVACSLRIASSNVICSWRVAISSSCRLGNEDHGGEVEADC